MKGLSIAIMLALLAGLLIGCRFAVVEGSAMRVNLGAAQAEGEEGPFIIDDVEVDPLSDSERTAVAEALEAGKRRAANEDAEIPDKHEPDTDEDGNAGETPAFIGLHSRDEEGESKVRRLQERLVELGYLEDGADGVFGSRTLKALKHFQHDHDLETTGVLDDATKAVLYPQPEVTTPPEEVLFSEGASGSEVEMLQQMLRQYGFSDRPADGEFDESTAEEVMAFQRYAVKYYGTEFDEPIDVDALLVETSLVASDAELPAATPAPAAQDLSLPEMPALAPAATLRPHHAIDGVVSENLYAYLLSGRFPVYRTTVQRGDWGEEVERVQRRLINLDFLYDAADGEFGEATIAAVKFFQRRNSLQETGIADVETQNLMFSKDALPAEQVEKPFYIKVSIDDQRVYVYRWEDGDYRHLIRTMICSTGLGNSTPRGVFVSPGHRDSRWHYFVDFNCWAQYAFVIRGNILFHSVLYSSRSESSLRQSSVYNLGHKASHGCVRLRVVDAKWIYEHCGPGQVIEVY